MTSSDIDAYLREPHIANLATLMPDGAPHVAPVWHIYDGKQVIVVAERTAVKVRNVRNDDRVCVSVATDAKPYRYVIVWGTASLSEENIREYVLEMATNYLGNAKEGEEYTEEAMEDYDFVALVITPTKMSSQRIDD